jgi:hypothetical protein
MVDFINPFFQFFRGHMFSEPWSQFGVLDLIPQAGRQRFRMGFNQSNEPIQHHHNDLPVWNIESG